MATPIDDKVVAMSFDSKKFEAGVSDTISSLDKLKGALKFPNIGRGFEDISRAVGHLQLNRIGDAADNVQKRLRALQLVGIGVMSNLASSAIRSGLSFAKSFTLQPLIAGFQEYSTNLNSIQTILANTQASGANLKDVNAALDELNTYSDKTIYNFSQMAKNIGTFTAAGVDLKTSTASIKGIANLAALSGSNAQQASSAMYQLSQAIAGGSVRLQDWISVRNASMGGAVFQRALTNTAVSMGTLDKKLVKISGSMKTVKINGEDFAHALAMKGKDGKGTWLTSDVLTQTLKQFTGDLSDAELAAQGFTSEQIKAIQQTAKTANFAATEVKTLSQVFDVAKETMGSGWALTFRNIFGDFVESKKTFTDMSNAINDLINKNAEARNKILDDWKALGGRTVIIKAISEAFHNLGMIIKPIKQAFRDIFPAQTGRSLYNFTLRFKAFVDTLKPSPQTIENLRRTFRGLFALLDIGRQIIKGVWTMWRSFSEAIGVGNGGILKVTGNVGDLLVAFDKWLKKGNRLQRFFSSLGDSLAKPARIILKMKDAIVSLFSGISSGGASGQISGMTKAFTPFRKLIEAIKNAWDKFMDSLQNADIQPALDAIVKVIQGFGKAVGEATSNMSFEPILAVIRTGLFGGLVLILKRFLGKGSFLQQMSKAGGGFVKNMSGMFDNLTGSMKAMQQSVKADILKKIATAVALLTASIIGLSFVDPKRLKSALAGISVAMGQLLAAMGLLTATTRTAGFVKLPLVTGGLIALAAALDTLSLAVLAMSRLSWNGLVKGLAGTAGALGILVAAVVPLSKGSAGLVRAGIGVNALAIALNFMALAVKQFGGMNLLDLAKGLGGIAASLGLVILSMNGMETERIMAAGAGLIGIAIALRIMANAVAKFAGMSLKDIGKGLVGIGGSLVIIAYAMELFPPGMPVIAAGLLLVSLALGRIAKAVLAMSKMGWIEIARGLTALGGALALLATGMAAMQETVGGAAALTIASAGIFVLSKALIGLGKQSWSEILKSLVTLASALAILGVAGVALSPTIPALLGLGVALLAIGAGLALAGAGIALIGVGLSAIAVAGPTALSILIASLSDFYKTIPELAKNLALGLLQIVDGIAKTAPKFLNAIVKIVDMLLDAIIRLTPKFVVVIETLIDALVKILHDKQDKFIKAGIDLILALLMGIRNNIGQATRLVLDILTQMLNAIAQNLGKVITAGANVLISLLKGIANNIGRVLTAADQIIFNFISHIGTFARNLAGAGLKILTQFLGGIASNLKDAFSLAGRVILRLIDGFGTLGLKIANAGTDVLIKFLGGLSKNTIKIVNACGQTILNILIGVRKAIDLYLPQITEEGERIGVAIVKGMIKGIASMPLDIAKAGWGLAGDVMGAVKDKAGVKSPSKEMAIIGQNMVEGFVIGLNDHDDVITSAATMSIGFINAIKDIFQITSPSKTMAKLGAFVNQGFVQGLTGTAPDIQKAFTEMNTLMSEAMIATKETIVKEQEKLDALLKAKTPDMIAIKRAQIAVAQSQMLLQQQTYAHIALTAALQGQRTQLEHLANDYTRVSDKLKTAQQALADVRKMRDDAVKGFSDQYGTLPDIVTEDAEGNSIDQLATYLQALDNQAKAVAAYHETLDQLRQLGLDDATYQKLLEEGPQDQAFANQLLAGGKTAVEGLNKLDAELAKQSKSLAKSAGKNLYQAGVDAAQGLVDGLAAKKKAIAKEMASIAKEIVTAIKRELGIASPSKVFMEVGGFVMAGLAKGLTDSSKAVSDALSGAADDAMSALKKSMQGISDAVTDHINPNPTITPVIDLTQVRAQASELAALANPSSSVSYGHAAAISAQALAAQQDALVAGYGGTSVKFEQNNYSPEALSAIDIYRQTRNQLSQIKSVVAATP